MTKANGHSFIRLVNVDKRYQRGDEEIVVFDAMNLVIEQGDFVAVMGPSGSGKTTLLNLIGGIDRVDRGEVWHLDLRLDLLKERQLTAWRTKHIAFVFQHYNLLSMLSAKHNVELPLLLTPLSRKQRMARVGDALTLVGLAQRAEHLPSQLSGGQQQRVAIARAVVADMPIILCDEPTGNLDRAASNEVLDILHLLNQDFGKTIVMVTHDQEAAAYGRSIIRLVKGEFVHG